MSSETANPNTADRSVRRAYELAFVIGFIAVNLIVPLLTPDLYPLTAMPMYSAKRERLYQVEVYGPNKNVLNAVYFGVHSTDVANPRPLLGRAFPKTLWRSDRLIDEAQLRERVQACLKDVDPNKFPYVDVVQKVWASEGEELVVVEKGQWRIQHPKQ